MKDQQYMLHALNLARKGCGWVNPNPMVGAVIVKNGVIIGEGFHQKYGQLHAERNALANCTQPTKGATMYVTLEPCCHFGKTPPCTQAIIESGIKRVVIGSADPNPLVAGKGTQILKENGIEVTEFVLQEECMKLNTVFFHYIKTKLPYVVMKYAMTMDGKIATRTLKSKWITGEVARQKVQQDRHRYSGIMVGVQTVLSDDPMLTCRLESCKTPVRIICDTHLRTPVTANVVATASKAKTILATCLTDVSRHQPYIGAGCDVLVLPQKDGHVDLRVLMKRLGEMNIDSVLLEGGGTLNESALKSGIVNKIQAYIAPKIFGGKEAKSPVSGMGVDDPNRAYKLSTPVITALGNDILLESEVVPCSQEL